MICEGLGEKGLDQHGGQLGIGHLVVRTEGAIPIAGDPPLLHGLCHKVIGPVAGGHVGEGDGLGTLRLLRFLRFVRLLWFLWLQASMSIPDLELGIFCCGERWTSCRWIRRE